MSDNPSSPWLDTSDMAQASRHDRPRSSRSSLSSHSHRSRRAAQLDESTPLLSRGGDEHHDRGSIHGDSPATPTTRSIHSIQNDRESNRKRSRIRWPTVVALAVLGGLVIAILALGFAAPAVIEEYVKQAATFEPTDLSIDSITSTGVRARIRGDFKLDGSRVMRRPVRDLGRAGTWIARQVESRQSQVKVYLPERGNVLLGSAVVPPIVVSIRDGQVTPIDFLVDLQPGEVDGIRQLANDWVGGRIGQLRVQGRAEVPLKSGIFSFGTQSISETLLFKGTDIPSMPPYQITKFNVHEIQLPGTVKGMAADVSITALNDYPITFTVPALGFEILVSGCTADDDLIPLANATSQEIAIVPKENIIVNAEGVIRQLPKILTATCPDTHLSPLDVLLRDYMHGAATTFYVRGADAPSANTPTWISDLIKSVTVPVPFPGHTFDGLIRNFTMDRVHLSLPDPSADPNSPGAAPKISAIIKVIANLPEEMNFPIGVNHVRANADVFYQSRQLGVLDLRKWQKSNSSRIIPHDGIPAGIAVDAIIEDAPLNVTDDDVFTDLIQAMLFGSKGVILGVKANVDVETVTALGTFVVRDIPAQGKVPIKPQSGHGFDVHALAPKITSLKVLDTTETTILLEARLNVTNPTNYSATVPYININILNNGSVLGNASAKNVDFVPGNNTNIVVKALWDPLTYGGEEGLEGARDLISQYISGFNTTLVLRTHEATFPSLPRLGSALSNLRVEIPTPRLRPPTNPNHPDDGEEDGDKPRFIDDATMHLFTSTATFTLLSPLKHNTLFLTHINATALYNHTEPVGEILYDVPFAIPPGATTSPRLPVDWNLGSVGYKAIRDALGGTLKLDAKAIIDIKLGKWEERLWYRGGGISAHIKP